MFTVCLVISFIFFTNVSVIENKASPFQRHQIAQIVWQQDANFN